MKTNRSNKLFDQTRIATLGLQDLLAFGQLQPDGTYKVRNVTNSNFLNAIVISEQITYAEILALATASELVAGKNYTITNAVSGTLSLYIFAVSTSKLAEYGYDTTTGQVYSYDLATDTATNADNTGYINFTPQTAPAYQRGRVWYDSTTETLSVYDDISGTSVQLGQEEILRARNSTGSTILNGAVVYVSGAQGQNPRVSLALANAESTSRVIGVATHNIDNNSVGKITTFGIVGDLNTSAYNEGDVLYLSASVAGGLTTTRPSAPNQAVMVGTVIHAAVNDGKILVHTDNYGVGFGTANQVRGMNAAGTAEEYKTIQGTASEVEVLHTANTVTIGLPNAVTISGAMTAGSFVKSGGVSAQFLKADGTVDANAYFYTNAQVTGQALTGLSVSGSAVVSTDSILTGIGKLQNQINAVLGSVNFQGVWNASTNTPTLTSSVGTKGYYYIVTVAGSTNLNGITDWKLGDWAIYDGSAWQKVDNTDAVVSVNGYTGIVTLAAADVGALPTSAISGTTGKLPKFTASGAIGDSIVSESGGSITIGGTLQINAASGYNALFQQSGTDLRINYLNQDLSANVSAAYRAVGYTWQDNGGSAIMSLSATELITFGATDTGEAHIFGGSARVNGNVGIGVSPTNAKLEVVATTGEVFRADASGGAYRIIANQTDVLLGGNVGIGTTSPTAKFHLVTTTGAYGAALAKFEDGWSVSSLKFTNPVGTFALQAYAQDNPSFYLPLVLNNQGGNVLVGTATDDGVNKLQVSGSLVVKQNTSNLDGEIFLGQNTLYRGRIFYDGSINGQFIFDNRYDTTSATGGFLFRTRTNGTPVNALQIAGDGSATFSSSVTATSFTAGGRTRVEAGQIVDLGGAGNNTGIFFGSGAIISIDGSGNATVKDLGTSSFRWGKIFAQTINLSALPTSASGLSTGDLWNNGGVVNIV